METRGRNRSVRHRMQCVGVLTTWVLTSVKAYDHGERTGKLTLTAASALLLCVPYTRAHINTARKHNVCSSTCKVN